MWPFDRSKSAAPPAPKERAVWSTHRRVRKPAGTSIAAALARALKAAPVAKGMAMDAIGDTKAAWRYRGGEAVSDVLADWYASQSFIGHQMAAILAQHWMIDKACTMPGRDAIRQGYQIASASSKAIVPDVLTKLVESDRKYGMQWQLEEYIRKGRVFGVRHALMKVDGIDYAAPFNADGVKPNSYRGIVQIDPYWISPEFDNESVADPTSADFYEPTFWNIRGQSYHKSHFVIFRTSEVVDILKPQYMYGGVPIPQRIMERVYAAERTANEAPQLAMTKRLLHLKTDLQGIITNPDAFVARMGDMTTWRDNYGVKVGDSDEELQQFETSLNDLDEVIMTQYQIVAAAANVPATKLMGTTPKGFNSTGDYEEASYHEELETIQTHDLTPLLERHHQLVLLSDIGVRDVLTTITWNELDSPTAKEQAEINKLKAETDDTLVTAGAIDGQDVRDRLRNDPDSGYNGLSAEAPEPEPEIDPLDVAAIAEGTDPDADAEAPPSEE